MFKSGPFATSGPIAVVQSFPANLDPTKTFFTDVNGNPCFACGDAPQILPEMLSKADIDTYLADRAQRGINIMWMIMADRVYATTPPQNLNGDVPFTGGDFVALNAPYWAYNDYIMQRALVYGCTVLFMPAFMGLSSTAGYLTQWKAATDATLQGYAQALAARYQSFKNLIWVIGGDADPNDATLYAKLSTFAVALKAADPVHLMTLEASRFKEDTTAAPNGGYSSVDAHTIAYGSVQSWLDINWVYQTGSTVLSGAQRCYSQGKPCLLGEDYYELDHSITSIFCRGEGYLAILGGCTLGRLVGNGAVWGFNSANADLTTPSWQSQLSSVGAAGQQLMGNLFRSREWQKLVPDIAGTVMTVGSANGAACARTSDGQSIIVYIPSGGPFSVTIDMTKITDSGSQANCNWYNPATAAVTNIGTLANTGTHSFTTPDANDWVLVIDSHAANLRTPGT